MFGCNVPEGLRRRMGKDAGCEGLLETEEKIKWSGGGSCVIPKNDCWGKRNMINMLYE